MFRGRSIGGPSLACASRVLCCLAFGGTRTYHRLICAIEDAGWEIRDCLMWLYGQGFPKAADVGKMIDKAKGAVREVVGTKLGQPGYSLADNGRTNEVYGDLHNPEAECAITAPATPEAAKWTGWANALKPAWEPIVLAMKPMDGTLAHNAADMGRGGHEHRRRPHRREPRLQVQRRPQRDDLPRQAGRADQAVGREEGQPVHRIHQRPLAGESAAGRRRRRPLDDQTGTLTAAATTSARSPATATTAAWARPAMPRWPMAISAVPAGSSTAARRPRRRRGPGNDHPYVKPVKLMEYLLTLLSTPDGGVILDPFAGSGTTLLAAKRLGRRCIGVELTEHNCEIARGRLHVG